MPGWRWRSPCSCRHKENLQSWSHTNCRCRGSDFHGGTPPCLMAALEPVVVAGLVKPVDAAGLVKMVQASPAALTSSAQSLPRPQPLRRAQHHLIPRRCRRRFRARCCLQPQSRFGRMPPTVPPREEAQPWPFCRVPSGCRQTQRRGGRSTRRCARGASFLYHTITNYEYRTRKR